ncbi:MAG: DUF2156 domain-containing protein [Fibrobacter sp.]|nr:DUF2156 domain-containing protein [Fibrobacter sp.]
MPSLPQFPEFKPLEIADINPIRTILWNYQPQTSELTFTNLFIWRKHFNYHWCIFKNWLLITCKSGSGFCALEPVGPPPREYPVRILFEWLQQNNTPNPGITRADSRLCDEIKGISRFSSLPVREHFDYLYSTQSLITLQGRHLHSKRNHLTKFQNSYSYSYKLITADLISSCIDLATRWCKEEHCDHDPLLCDEWLAINEILVMFDRLRIRGGAILIDNKLEAFTAGELLNQNTAVIHIEKANPHIHGLYTAINQMFCEREFSSTEFVNREQDLGDEGLRKAKLSYHPVKLVEKYTIRL